MDYGEGCKCTTIVWDSAIVLSQESILGSSDREDFGRDLTTKILKV